MAATIQTTLEHRLQVALGNKDAGTQVFKAIGGGVPGSVAGDAAGTGVRAVEAGSAARQTVLTLTNAVVPIGVGTARDFGNLKIYDFPECLLSILGATCDLTTLVAGGGVPTNAALIASVGEANCADDGTLTLLEANIIPQITGTLGVGTLAGTLKGKSTTPVILDGTAGAKDAILNIVVPATPVAGGTVTVNGTITITWINLGDVA